jgi:DNA-binding NtrC family response regulator
MPKLDGYRLIGAALGFHPRLKVVMMTGYANATAPKHDRDGVIPILRKPLSIDLLVDTVDGVFAKDPKVPLPGRIPEFVELMPVKAA